MPEALFMVFQLDSKGAKVCNVNLVDLVEKFQTSIQSLLGKFGVDMAENEPLKVCQQLAES